MSDYYADGSVMGETVDLVTEKMRDFKNISDQHTAFLRGVLGDLANVKIADVDAPPDLSVPDVAFSDLSVPENKVVAPDLSDLDDIELTADFPNPPAIQMPTAPTMAEYTAPVKPDINNINTDIDIPDISRYQADLDKVVAVAFNWQEPQYQCELLDTLHAKIKGIVSGNDTDTGLPIEIEQALFDRARDRETKETLRQKQEIIDTWASRGFELPSGVINKQLDALAEQDTLKTAALNRDILVQSAQWHIETLRFAIEKGVALEELCFNIWNNGVNRLFESVRFAFTAEIEKQKAVLAMVETLLKTAQIKADVVQTEVEVFKTRFDAYRSEVAAFAEMISAEKVKFDAYAAQINAERSKMDAYKTIVQAHAERLKSKADVVGTVANTKITKYKADIDAYRAELQVAMSEAELKNKYSDMTINTTMNFERLKIEEYKAKLQKALQEAQLALEAMKSLGQFSAQLAAGAMSAQHISASMSAHGSASDSTSNSRSYSESHNYSY